MLEGYDPDKYILDAFPDIDTWGIEFRILVLEYKCVVNLKNAIIAEYMNEAYFGMMVEDIK